MKQEHDRDARTQVALWKRDNREALKLWVKGMIMLEPDDAKRAAAEESPNTAPSSGVIRCWWPPMQPQGGYWRRRYC